MIMSNPAGPRRLLVTLLYCTLVFVVVAAIYRYRMMSTSPTLPEGEVLGRWSATDGKPVPADFELLAFPKTPYVPIYDGFNSDKVVAHLNRAMIVNLGEMRPKRVSVILAVDVEANHDIEGWVDRDQLTFDPTGREASLAATTEFLGDAWPAMTALRAIAFVPVPDGGPNAWSLTADWGDVVRFGFYRVQPDGTVEPLSALETRVSHEATVAPSASSAKSSGDLAPTPLVERQRAFAATSLTPEELAAAAAEDAAEWEVLPE